MWSTMLKPFYEMNKDTAIKKFLIHIAPPPSPSELHQRGLFGMLSRFPVRLPYLEKYSKVDCIPLRS